MFYFLIYTFILTFLAVFDHAYSMDLSSDYDDFFSHHEKITELVNKAFIASCGSSKIFSDSGCTTSETLSCAEDEYESDHGIKMISVKKPPFHGIKKPSVKKPPFCKTRSFHEKKKAGVNIAIVGSGLAGLTTASLLSNLSDEDDDVIFNITILERSPQIINGSTSETAAILHGGGREYPKNEKTTKQCQETGTLLRAMFPGLYAEGQPIAFAIDPTSDLTPKIQEETYKNARKPTHPSDEQVDFDSQQDIATKTLQDTFPSLPSAVLSHRDIPTGIFKRNAFFKEFIFNSKNIKVKMNFEVSRILKDGELFKIFDKNGQKCDKLFDQVILTAWDQTKNISLPVGADVYESTEVDSDESSSATGNDSTAILAASGTSPVDFSDFNVIGRVLALCDMRDVPPLQRTPIMTLTEGGMFIPLNDDIALACRCAEGATYPKAGATEIPENEVLEHGQKIVDELEVILGRDNKVKLLGARYQRIVKRAEAELAARAYEPPMIPQKGIIVGLPPKATFTGSLALQIMEQILLNLPDSRSAFKEKWINEIKEIVPNNDCLCAKSELPKAFIIDIECELNQADVLNETLQYFKSCQLTETGEELRQSYQAQYNGYILPKRKRSYTLSSTGLISKPLSLERSFSDPLNGDIETKAIHSPTLFSMKVEGAKRRIKKARFLSAVKKKEHVAQAIEHITFPGVNY